VNGPVIELAFLIIFHTVIFDSLYKHFQSSPSFFEGTIQTNSPPHHLSPPSVINQEETSTLPQSNGVVLLSDRYGIFQEVTG
jgi:hypothetical protein